LKLLMEAIEREVQEVKVVIGTLGKQLAALRAGLGPQGGGPPSSGAASVAIG
jgi:hypothetical protein